MNTPLIIYWAIIALGIFDLLLDLWLTALNEKASHLPIPRVLDGLYNEASYRKQQSYAKENRRLALIAGVLSSIASITFFALGGYAWLDDIVRDISLSPILRALLFFGAFYVASFLISLPFSIYSTFSIEQRYGFNKSTPKLFAVDTVKSFLLNVVLTGGLLAIVVWIYTLNPQLFWLIAFGVYITILLVLQYFASDIIVPLFNKQKPLEDGELKSAIEAFAKKAGFQLENIYVMDESKRTTKANAYFTGFGKKKRVVLFDTMIEQLTIDEIVGVLAHEIGHYKKHHLLKDIAESIVISFLMFWAFSFAIDSSVLAAAAGCSEPSFHVNLVVFASLLYPLNLIYELLGNSVSRKHEREADAFAKEHDYGSAEASALKKMSAQALENLTPHPIVVKFEYSHPTLAERVIALTKG